MTAHRILNGRYEVLELIGRGGMADVHLGRDLRLGRCVAIKVLRQDLARDPLFQSRFRREAQAVAGLNNPNIVAVYDTGEEEIPDRPQHEVRVPFIVMEYVQGRTLRDHVKAGDLTQEDSVSYLAGVLGALQYSHRAGIVHRDIKPANVMITPDGDVKVMDFGIARAMADSQATMTQTQAVLGTAQYLSPEQARGEPVDARSDLYSAGCLLFELLTGRPPFVGDSPVSVVYQQVREEPPAASSINSAVTPALDAVLSRALQKNREDRFQDADGFRRALLDAGRGIVPAGSTTARTETLDTTGRHSGPEHAETALLAGLAAASSDPRTQAMERVSAEDGAPRGLPADDHAEDGFDVLATEHDPRRRSERGHRSGRAAWVTVFFLVVLLVLAGGYLLLDRLPTDQASPTVATVVVPELVGMTEADATDAIVDAGLIPSSDEQFNATVAAGSVISSDPPAGASVSAESRVNITVSQGPANVVLPDSLVGLTESSARDRLEELGLRGGTVTEETSAEVPDGRVITTSPPARQTVPVGSSVDLVLSNGKVVVPLLTDLTVQQAEALLADPAVQLPFTVHEVENSVVAPGIVTAQSRQALTTVDQGTEVVLTVAKAPVVTTAEPAQPSAPTAKATPQPTAPAVPTTQPAKPSAPTSDRPSAQPSGEPSGQPTKSPDDSSGTRPTEDGR